MPRLRRQDDPGYTTVSIIQASRWLCFAISAACFVLCGWIWLDQHLHQGQAEELFSSPAAAATPSPQSGPIARLEIARLGVSGFVEVGLDAKTLRRAIGLSPLGARPGQSGNTVLAAHRDTFFAGLKDARTGDLITLETPSGRTFRYRISRTFVVSPSEMWVMRSTPDRNMLTLITCYPFGYIGKAPRRLVVRARPIGLGVPAERSNLASLR